MIKRTLNDIVQVTGAELVRLADVHDDHSCAAAVLFQEALDILRRYLRDLLAEFLQPLFLRRHVSPASWCNDLRYS